MKRWVSRTCFLFAAASLLAGCTTVKDGSNRIANKAKESVMETRIKLEEYFTYKPTSKKPGRPVPDSYCYKVYQDIMCVAEAIPGRENQMVGWQGTTAWGRELPGDLLDEALPPPPLPKEVAAVKVPDVSAAVPSVEPVASKEITAVETTLESKTDKAEGVAENTQDNTEITEGSAVEITPGKAIDKQGDCKPCDYVVIPANKIDEVAPRMIKNCGPCNYQISR